jgi:integrase/recombinase XerD
MNPTEQQRYNNLYQQHLTNLTLQGKRPATIDAYSRAVRRISEYFDRSPDTLTTDELKTFFASLIKTHSWSTVKLDRNGLQFFYRYQVFFLTLYSMSLRLSEGLNLTIHDIHSHTMQVHIREAKSGKDRLVPLPKRTLYALRTYSNSVGLTLIASITGHASLNTTARYTQLAQFKQHDAAIAINKLTDNLNFEWSLK